MPKKKKMYEVKMVVGEDFNGKPIRKSFYSTESKKKAIAKGELYKANQAVMIATGEFQNPTTITFEKWCSKVLDSVKGTIKDSSYELSYVNCIKNHLIPYFGRAKVYNIKQIDVQKYFKVKGKELSLETLKKHRMVLHKIFEMAVVNDICSKNPCIDIKLSSSIAPIQKQTYDKTQCDLIIAYAKTHRFGLEVYLLLEYGLSRSELLGLMWDDLDEENEILKIQRGVTDVKDSATGKMTVVIGDTKNDFRNRTIPLKHESVEYLLSCRHDGKYIIRNQKNKKRPCSPRTWSRRHYDVFMKDMQSHYAEQGIEMPILNPHELRHTRASIWVNDDKNLFAVADVLGHSDLKMLRKRYAHADVESVRKLLKLDES